MALSPKYAAKSLVVNDGAIAGYVGTRIYEQSAPQSPTVPYIIFGAVGREHMRHMGGASDMASCDVQFDICDGPENGERCEAIAERMRLVLQAYQNVVTVDSESVTIEYITLESDEDDFVPADNGTDGGTYVRTLVFKVWHREAVPA